MEFGCVAEVLIEFLPAFDWFGQAGNAAGEIAGFVGVIPEVRLRSLLLEDGQSALFAFEVKETSRAAPAAL